MQMGGPYGIEWSWNFEGLEMQKLNIPMGRVQRVDEKNGVIYLVIMFSPGVMVIYSQNG